MHVIVVGRRRGPGMQDHGVIVVQGVQATLRTMEHCMQRRSPLHTFVQRPPELWSRDGIHVMIYGDRHR